MFCKIILPSNEIHKLPSVPETYEDLYNVAVKKFKGKVPDNFYFKYKDSDDELITLSNDEDFQTAKTTSEADKVKTLRIFLIPENGGQSVNPNFLIQNLSPASHGSYTNENFMDKTTKSRFLVGNSYSQSVGKRPSDVADNLGESDFNRLAEQLPGGADRLKLGQAHIPHLDQQDESYLARDIPLEKSIYLEGLLNHGLRDQGSIPFNQEQLNAIIEMLEKKLKDRIEQRVQLVVTEIMAKLNDEYRNKSLKKNPYTHTPYSSTSKSIVPSFGSRTSLMRKSVKTQEGEEHLCSNCRRKIDDVKYTCSECGNVDFCETCEEKAEHPHPLLKTRLGRKAKASLDSSEVSNANINTGPATRNYQDVVQNPMHANKSQSYGANMGADSQENRNYESSGSSPSENHFPQNKGLRYSNTVSQINFNDRNSSESNSSHQPKNPSNFSGVRSQQMSKSYVTPGGTPFEKEPKRFKATIVKPPVYDLINVKPGNIYYVEFTIKNSGGEAWPEGVKIVCINGVHKGVEESIPALGASIKHEVKLKLKAPLSPNRYLSQWKLHYYEDEAPKAFGSNLFIEINVTEGSKKDKEREQKENDKAEKIESEVVQNKDVVVAEPEPENKDILIAECDNSDVRLAAEAANKDAQAAAEIENRDAAIAQSGDRERAKPVEVGSAAAAENKDRPNPVEENRDERKGQKKNHLSEEDLKLIRETNCSEMVLNHAKQLHSMYPDQPIVDQIDFIEACPIHLDVNDIVIHYMNRLENKNSVMNDDNESPF